jgi:hypothetical protein
MDAFDKWIMNKRIKQSNRRWVIKQVYEALFGLIIGAFLFFAFLK